MMKHHLSRSIVLLLVFILPSIAVSANNEGKSAVTQTAWLSQFEILFATGLCEKSDYVTTCLRSSTSECKLAVKEQIPKCARAVQLPSRVAVGSSSEIWGDRMGRCLGPKLINKSVTRKEDEKCKNLSAW